MTPLCPGCEQLANEDFVDAAGRSWHCSCAYRALGESFRTPLSPDDAAARVSFEVCFEDASSAWRPPHSLHLREIIFCDDVELSQIFIGNKMMIYTAGTTVRSVDLPERRLVLDCDLPLGIHLAIAGVPHKFRVKLVGERRRESHYATGAATLAAPAVRKRAIRQSLHMLAVGGVRSYAPVAPGGAVETRFRMPVPFRGERVVCDDWGAWELVDIRLGVDPGCSQLAQVPGLTGRSTRTPSYESAVGEEIVYKFRNRSEQSRVLDARIYGTLRF